MSIFDRHGNNCRNAVRNGSVELLVLALDLALDLGKPWAVAMLLAIKSPGNSGFKVWEVKILINLLFLSFFILLSIALP